MKPRELPDTVYIPSRDDWSFVDRDDLMDKLAWWQDQKCVVCGERLSGIVDVHECIVTKGDVQSWPDSWKHPLIFNIYNCSSIHRACHEHGDRQVWWNYKCEQFGKEEMEKWYYNLPFRGKIRRFE